MKYFAIALTSAIALSSAALANQEDERNHPSVEVSFVSDGTELHGTLYKPHGEGPFPAIIAFHGSGSPDRDLLMYRHLAEVLTPQGVAVFLYDRRDISIPPEERTSLDYRVLAADGAAAARAIAARDSIDAERVGAWGVSQGGWLVPMANTIAPEAINFQILVSPSGEGPAGQMMYATERGLRDAGLDEDTIQAALEVRRTIYAYFRHEITRDEAQQAVDTIKDEPWYDMMYMGRDVIADPTLSGWYQEMRFEPQEYFERIDTPVALIFAGDDPLIDIDSSKEIFRAALAEAGNNDFEIHRIAGTGHTMLLNEAELLADPDNITLEDFASGYEQAMIGFLERFVLNR
ncbi:alpha/beta hydrolase family protein [Glycocaulis sp.]|uniref:alpha/beta hydrolase family protein n=1 Tax=Glycocaulis sp. TaxID=1969725 RepID=UPI003D1FC53F